MFHVGDTGEIKNEVREQIDNKVSEWRNEGKVSSGESALLTINHDFLS